MASDRFSAANVVEAIWVFSALASGQLLIRFMTCVYLFELRIEIVMSLFINCLWHAGMAHAASLRVDGAPSSASLIRCDRVFAL